MRSPRHLVIVMTFPPYVYVYGYRQALPMQLPMLVFGGALLAYAIYRNTYHYAFAAASNLENWKIGLVNTFVLLFSSYTVAALTIGTVLLYRRDTN